MSNRPTPRSRFSSGSRALDPKEERALGTHGSKARYHDLLDRPFSIPLIAPGYIIGLEKADRAKIGFPERKGHDKSRLTSPHAMPLSGNPRDLSQQRRDFDRIMRPGHMMFLSHLIRYAAHEDRSFVEPRLAYSAYQKTGFDSSQMRSAQAQFTAGALAPYEQGWWVLDQLADMMLADIDRARRNNHPFTHILLMSMGWNNDQFEALERYNDLIMQTMRNTDERDFNPLVIGLTWPSVWKWNKAPGVVNSGLHVASYFTKCLDADQVGFTYMNALVNHILPQVEAKTGLRTVMIGHSMGARILTRAYYSAQVLQHTTPRRGKAPIVIGLQGAFSANRFAQNMRLRPPFRWFVTGEGGPYQDHLAPGGDLLLTWAMDDKANPVAKLATGASHVGGRFGAQAFERHPLNKTAHHTPWAGHDALELSCAIARDSGEFLYIDASNIIGAHGDIRDAEVGALVWAAISGFDKAA
jgi:hypothetical protein